MKKNIAYSFFDQAVVSGSNVILAGLVVRKAGYEVYGLLAILLIVAALIVTIQSSIITSIMVTVYPSLKNEDTGKYISSVNWMFLAFAASCIGLATAAYPIVREMYPSFKTASSYTLAVVFIFFCSAQDYLRRLLFLTGKAKLAFASDTSYYGSQMILVYLLLDKTTDIEPVLKLFLLPGCITMLLAVKTYSDKIPSKEDFSQYSKLHWTSGKWLFLSSILNWFSGSYFILLGGGVLGNAAIGFVRSIQNIYGIIVLAFQAFENFMPKYLATLYHKEGFSGFIATLKRIILLFGIFLLITIGFFYLFSDSIGALLYAKEYKSSVDISLYIAASTFLIGLTLPIRYALRVLGFTKPFFIAYSIISAECLLIASWLVEVMGLHGVGIGIAAVQGQVFILLLASLWWYARIQRTDRNA